MKKYSLLARLKVKIEKNTNFLFFKLRQKQINNLDFTIISNNCWGGVLV